MAARHAQSDMYITLVFKQPRNWSRGTEASPSSPLDSFSEKAQRIQLPNEGLRDEATMALWTRPRDLVAALRRAFRVVVGG